jgi:hypothetical protein
MSEATSEFVRENLWDLLVEAETKAAERGRQIDTIAADRCTACGRKVGANGLLVEVDTGGNVILPGSPLAGTEASQGWWEIGSECAKRVLTAAERKQVRAAMKAEVAS